ncbi:MAG: PQQ-binding-like beta-propeller repeat protein [Acidobacteriota bacterium]
MRNFNVKDRHRLVMVVTLFAWILLGAASGRSQEGAGPEWRHYGGDSGGSRYSPLTQINRTNVTELKVAWIFHTGDLPADTMNATFECTPLVVEGVMYLSTPFSKVIALEAETGKMLWTFDPKLDGSYGFVNRGVAFWQDKTERRIFLATSDGRLFALDAHNGTPVSRFGNKGWIDLKTGMVPAGSERSYGVTSPPLVYQDLVMTGSIVPDSLPQGPSGDVRAFDARTGQMIWRFHSVPHPGEFGHDTWESGAWRDRGGTNVWAPLSCDERRGIVYLPLTSASPDRYGGDRKGSNLFADSLVALNAKTGKRIWHYQIVHHDLWDFDLPAQPNLITLQRNGVSVPAVAQVTKMGLTFIFNRLTGKPLFDIEERAVPPSEVPGEVAWPTQPFPVKPPPLARLSMTPEDLTDVTPESRAECSQILKDAVLGKAYQPPGLRPTIIFPGTMGGANWGGAAYDPISNLLFVNSQDTAQLIQMTRAREGSEVPFVPRGSGYGRFWDSRNYPCQKPPWGTLTAIDLSKGSFHWQVPLGIVEELVAKGIPPTGTSNVGGSIVTAGGLVFIGATNDRRFRAFDKDTGKELWVTTLEASAHATPMTFMGARTGKQYVVIAAGGGSRYNKTHNDALVAFALFPEGQSRAARVRGRREVRVISEGPGREPRDLKQVKPRAQPVSFSHLQHDLLGLECRSCHPGNESGEILTIPGTTECMSCHATIRTESASVRRLARFHQSKQPVPWVRLYRLPGFVFFSHQKHANDGIECATCHGPAGSRDVLWQEKEISMEACVSCHKSRQASVECGLCHDMEH